jgi:MazG family protein
MDPMTPAQTAMQHLLDIIARLRSPGGCPWDRAQTKESLRPYVLEEAYEVIDAIDSDSAAELCDELGDLLLQIVLQARLQEEEGLFTFADVCNAISEKMVRRHPHVFSEPSRQWTTTELQQQWQAIKAREARATPPSPASSPSTLPSLLMAQKSSVLPGERDLHQESTLRQHLDNYLQSLTGGPVAATESALADLLLLLAQSADAQGINAELALRRRVLAGQKSSRNEKS